MALFRGNRGTVLPSPRERPSKLQQPRVAVSCREGDPPLRVGMSTTVEIDTGHSRSIGGLLAGLGKSLGLSSASATAKP